MSQGVVQDGCDSARLPGLNGKSAIITGTSRGIGCGIARVLGSQGMKLVLTARSADRGREFAESLRRQGVACRFEAADVSDWKGAEKVYAAAREAFGPVDVLVNNAADMHSKSILDLVEEDYRRTFEKNVRIVYGLSFLAARDMAARKRGNIVQLSSVGGLRAHRRQAGYDASKGAIDALTRSMALDLAPCGVRVNGVAPGAIRHGPASSGVSTKKEDSRAAGVPLGRVGTPEEIGWTVAFLASDLASYITGQVVYVDGGITSQISPPGIRI